MYSSNSLFLLESILINFFFLIIYLFPFSFSKLLYSYIFNVWKICIYIQFSFNYCLCVYSFYFSLLVMLEIYFEFFPRTSLHFCCLTYWFLLFIFNISLPPCSLGSFSYFSCSLYWVLRAVVHRFSSFLVMMCKFKAVVLICSMFITLSSEYIQISTMNFFFDSWVI